MIVFLTFCLQSRTIFLASFNTTNLEMVQTFAKYLLPVLIWPDLCRAWPWSNVNINAGSGPVFLLVNLTASRLLIGPESLH